ncbi:MAG: hypothetical protein ACP5EN_12805 [Rhodovulum sp.]
MRIAVALYVLPLGLLSLYVLMSLAVTELSACPTALHPPAPCLVLGLDVTRLPGIGAPGAALAPVVLAWLGLGGVAFWAARRVTGR